LKRHFGFSFTGTKSREQDATAATNAAFKREFRLFKLDQSVQQEGAAPRTLASVSEAPGTALRVIGVYPNNETHLNAGSGCMQASTRPKRSPRPGLAGRPVDDHRHRVADMIDEQFVAAGMAIVIPLLCWIAVWARLSTLQALRANLRRYS
jgi:hypothetical protein